MKLYQVWGVHPESDSEWIVDIFPSEQLAQDCMYEQPEIDCGLGHYEIRVTE
jgi:hypothetical protein